MSFTQHEFTIEDYLAIFSVSKLLEIPSHCQSLANPISSRPGLRAIHLFFWSILRHLIFDLDRRKYFEKAIYVENGPATNSYMCSKSGSIFPKISDLLSEGM